MTARHSLITQTAGDDWEINFELRVAGVPYDVVGAVIEWGLVSDAWVIVVGPSEVTVTVIDGLNGRVRLSVPRAVTEGLVAGRYYDSLRVTKSNRARTFATGVISVVRSVLPAA